MSLNDIEKTLSDIEITKSDKVVSDDDPKLFTTSYCSFTKVVLVEGEGVWSRPLLESQCNIGYVVSGNKNCDSLALVNELEEKKDFILGMSQDVTSIGLELMLMTMLEGEKSHFHVWWTPLSHDHPHSPSPECKAKTDHNEKEQHIVLALYSFTNVVPIWQLNPDEKYEFSLKHKNRGTELFQEDKVEAAFYQYSIAVKFLITISTNLDLPESDKAKYKHLKCLCYNNLAACQIKSENFESVIENCTKTLAIDAWNVKGLYRRAVAYKSQEKVDEARSDLIKIVKKEPKNKVAADLLESLMPTSNQGHVTS